MAATTRPVSRSSPAAVASANGKLAPQRIVDGKIAQLQRTRSRANPIHGAADRAAVTGQMSIDVASGDAAHAIVAARSIWHRPSAIRGCAIVRSIAEPDALPMP